METLIVGILLGGFMAFFGAGAGSLTIPLSVHLLGMTYGQAAIAGLCVVLLSGGVNAVIVSRRHELDLRSALPFLLLSTPLAILVGHLARTASNTLTALLLALLLFTSSVTLYLRKSDGPPGPSWKGWIGAALAGSASGALGVGAGFVVIPALRLISKLNMAVAVGTSSFVLAVNALFALAGKQALPPPNTLLLGMAAGVGVLIAAKFTRRIDPVLRQRALATFLFLFAVVTFFDAVS
ncbi:MAG: sulfite exporter TauE/SafE family protein [Actinobacteria bacterium]|nr:sulfite exporter TauE/SafE family protein [Actinomycetota bacterium]